MIIVNSSLFFFVISFIFIIESEYLSARVSSMDLAGIQNFLTSLIVLFPPHIILASQIDEISFVYSLFLSYSINELEFFIILYFFF